MRTVGVGATAGVGNAGVGVGASAATGRSAGATLECGAAITRAEILWGATVPIRGARRIATAVDATAEMFDRAALEPIFEIADLMGRRLIARTVIGGAAEFLAKAGTLAAGVVAAFGISRAPRQRPVVAARGSHARVAL
jgi:hypothetical protein